MSKLKQFFKLEKDPKKRARNLIVIGGLYLLAGMAGFQHAAESEGLTIYQIAAKYPATFPLWLLGLAAIIVGTILRNGFTGTIDFFRKQGAKYLAKFIAIVMSVYLTYALFFTENPHNATEWIFMIIAWISAFLAFLLLEWMQETSE